MFRKLAAECFGTFWLVFGGCGSAVLAAGFPELGIGFAGVALAFGLTVLTMAFAVGHISGGHFNPAVTIGLWAGGRFPAKEVVGYVIAQVVGGIVAAALLYLIASGKTGFDAAASGFASNGYGEHSPGGYSMLSALVVELVLSAGFLLVIHTSPGAAQLIARLLDSLGKAEGILGTIAGDDTIFITPTAETDMDELYESVLELFEHTG